jgi:hypothetical protein
MANPLPNELVFHIVSFLHPFTDRPTLVNLALASAGLWEIASKRLYRDLRLRDEQLRRLVAGSLDSAFPQNITLEELKGIAENGGSKFTARGQRAIGFIWRLRINLPSQQTLETLYAATLPNIPLFPNVRHVCLSDDDLGAWGFWRPPPPPESLNRQRQGPMDVVLFDGAAFCVAGVESMGAQVWLCHKNTMAWAFHVTVVRDWFDWFTEPTSWNSMRIFANGSSDSLDQLGTPIEWKRLETAHANDPNVHICLDIPLASMEDSRERLECMFDWESDPPKCYVTAGDACSPCESCGESCTTG